MASLKQWGRTHWAIIALTALFAGATFVGIHDADYLGADQGSYLLHSDILRGREVPVTQMWPRPLLAPGWAHVALEAALGIPNALKAHIVLTMVMVCVSLYVLARAYLPPIGASFAPVAAFVVPHSTIHTDLSLSPQGLLALSVVLIAMRLLKDEIEDDPDRSRRWSRPLKRYVPIYQWNRLILIVGLIALVPHLHQSVGILQPLILGLWVLAHRGLFHRRVVAVGLAGGLLGYLTALPWYLGTGNDPAHLLAALTSPIFNSTGIHVAFGVVFLLVAGIAWKTGRIPDAFRPFAAFMVPIVLLGSVLFWPYIVVDGFSFRLSLLAALGMAVSLALSFRWLGNRLLFVTRDIIAITLIAIALLTTAWMQNAPWTYLHSVLDYKGLAEAMNHEGGTGLITPEWVIGDRYLSALTDLPTYPPMVPPASKTPAPQYQEVLRVHNCYYFNDADCNWGALREATVPPVSHVVYPKYDVIFRVTDSWWSELHIDKSRPLGEHLILIWESEGMALYRIDYDSLRSGVNVPEDSSPPHYGKQRPTSQ